MHNILETAHLKQLIRSLMVRAYSAPRRQIPVQVWQAKPGSAVGALSTVATHNPLGLIVSTGVKTHEEKSGDGKLEGRALDTGKKIANMLNQRFEELGWIEGAGK